MKTRIALLSLLTIACLVLAVAPAMADTVFYDNGAYNGTIDGWTINYGFSVSNSYTNTPGYTSVSDVHFVYWDANSSDLLTTVDAQFGSTSFGGQLHTVGATGGTNTLLGSNQYGYELCQYDWAPLGADIHIGSGPGYFTLSNACTTSGCDTNPIYWDENSGPSSAYENTLGSIPSEAFTLSGGCCPPPVPEPSSIMLFGSGILGLAGVLRRKLNR